MEIMLKIEVPDGYEIDKEKSTFENIAFREVKKAEIEWNAIMYSVEIKADGEYFAVDARTPSYYCSWEDSMRFHRGSIWGLPTVKQLKVLAKHIEKVNECIRQNNGFEISGWFWSSEEKGESEAWNVDMRCGAISVGNKTRDGYVRAVCVLND